MRLAEELAPLVRDPVDRRELGHVVAEFDALWALTKRNVSQAARAGRHRPRRHDLQARVLRGPRPARASCRCGCSGAAPSTCTTSSSRSGCGRCRSRSRRARRRSSATSSASASSASRASGLAGGRPRVNFDLTEDQEALRDGIRSLCARAASTWPATAPASTASVWDELAETGVFSLLADGFGWADAAHRVRGARAGPLVPGPARVGRARPRRSSTESSARDRASPDPPAGTPGDGRAPRRARRAGRARPAASSRVEVSRRCGVGRAARLAARPAHARRTGSPRCPRGT